MIISAGFFVLSASAASAQLWVADPHTCPSTYVGYGQSCAVNGQVICGVNGSGNIECYNPDALTVPGTSVNSNTSYTGSYNGGYVMNCYAYDSAAPYCTNNDNWWCDRNEACSANNRWTSCTGGQEATSTCSTCLTDYYDCDANPAKCEVQDGVTACTGGVMNSACTCTCDSAAPDYYFDKDADPKTCEWGGPNVGGFNYHYAGLATSTFACNASKIDCNGDLTEANINAGSLADGCETTAFGACTTGYGSAGVWVGCSCVGSTMNFETGKEAKYVTDTALLWGTQYGTGPLLKLTSNNASTTGGIFFIGQDGEVGIGTSTPSSNNALTVGMNSGSQFIVNKNGVVTLGTWQGGVIGVAYGGTATSTWTAKSLVYASADNVLGEIRAGNPGQVLVLDGSSVPVWSNTAVGTAHGLLSAQHSDTTTTGTPTRGNLMVANSSNLWSALTLGANGFVLQSDGSDAVWNSFNDLWDTRIHATTTNALAEGTLNYYYTTNRFAASLSGTTTDALAQGAINRYWSDTLFDNRLSATTSLPNLATLNNLSTVGTITSGTWNASDISVANGGTGLSSVAPGYFMVGLDVNSLQATSSVYVSPEGRVGIGSTSPNMLLSVGGQADFRDGICLGGSCISSWGDSEVGGLSGSGIANQIAVWTGANTLGASSSLSIAMGGTGAVDATNARSNLGLSNIYDYGVDTIGALGSVWIGNGAGKGGWAATNTLGLLAPSSIGSLIQAYDAGLANLAGLNQNGLVYQTADNSFAGLANGANGTVLSISGGNLVWATTSAPSIHSLLSVSHSDVAATSTLLRGDLLVANSANLWNRLELGASGFVLMSNGGDAVWATTTAITALGTINQGVWNGSVVSVAYGGTGSTTLSGLLKGNGINGIQTALAGTDYLAGSAIGSGSQGFVPFYNASGNNLTATSSLFIAQSGNIGIGTTSPSARLTVWGRGTTTGLLVNFVNGASTSLFTLLENGRFGLGTTSPAYRLDVRGSSTAGQINAESGLCINGDCKTSWGASGIGGDLWTQAGSDISYTAGNVAIGTSTANAKLTVRATGTTTAMMVNFADGSNVSLFNLQESGLLTLAGVPTGSDVSSGSFYVNPPAYTTSPIVSWSAKTAWNGPTGLVRVAATFGDLNNDGKIDMVVGDDYDAPRAYENTGTLASPVWTLRADWTVPNAGSFAKAALADLNNDGKEDLLIGISNGNTIGYINTGTATDPAWTASTSWNVADLGSETAPAFADLDNDGDLDLMVGESGGTLYAYENIGSAFSPIWSAKPSWNGINTTSYPTPVFADLDGDGDNDLLVGHATGLALAYKNTGSASSPTWTAEPTWNTADIGTYASPALADLDNDGDSDLILGGNNSNLPGYENIGSLGALNNTLIGAAINSVQKFRVNSQGTIEGAGNLILGSGFVSIAFVGTSDALAVQQNGTGNIANFKDGANSAFIIKDGGNIGIGTTTPGFKLAIAGDAMISGRLYDNSYSAGTSGMVLQSSGTGFNWVATSSLGFGTGSGVVGLGSIGQIPYYAANGTELAATSSLYLASNGYIGIGTTSPVYRLDVRGSGISGQINAEAGICINGVCKTSWTDGGIGGDLWTQAGSDINYTSGNVSIGTTSTSTRLTVQAVAGRAALSIASSTGESLVYVGPNGYVGIGTSSPVARLSVKGRGTTTMQLVNFANANDVSLFSLQENGQAAFAGIPSGSGVLQGAMVINPASYSSNPIVSWSAKSAWNGTDPGSYASPVLADLNFDGKLDLLVGEYNTGVHGYINTGTVSSPVWTASSTCNTAYNGHYAVPALADLDGDGDLDLLVGDGDGGTSHAYENTGSKYSPVWTARAGWDTPDVGTYASPAFADLDNDGLVDLIIGSGNATSYGYENTGSVASPTWTANAAWNVVSPTTVDAPAVADLDGDGDLDLLIGENGGKTYGFENTGTVASPIWTRKTAWDGSDLGSYSHPSFADIDNDGDKDAYIGDNSGISYAYENVGSVGASNNTLFGIGVGGSERFRINGLGQLSVSGSLVSTSFISATYNGTSDALAISQSGSGNIVNFKDGVDTVFMIKDGGNVGLGTTTPNYRLTVAGDAMISGRLYDNSYSAGTSGMVLQSSGTGFNWVATSSLGFLDSNAIGTTIQPFDSDLLTYAGITPSGDIQTFLGSADYSAARTNLGLAIGTNVQAYNTALTAIASGTWAGSSSIVALGTVTQGVWNGTAISVQYGGTGSTTLSGILKGNGLNGIQTALAGTDYLAGSAIGNGSQGYIPFYNASGNNLTATSSFFIGQNGNIGIGTTSPGYKLQVDGNLAVNNAYFANPGIGNDSYFEFLKTNDSARIKVTEINSDETRFAFEMEDNPDSATDRFVWHISDWKGNGGDWEPLKFSSLNVELKGANVNAYGDYNIFGPWYSGGTYPNSGQANTVTVIKSGSLNVTPGVSAFTGTSARLYNIKIDGTGSPNTFKWDVDCNPSGSPTPCAYANSGIPITGAAQTLDSGVTVTFSAITGGVLNDLYQFRVYKGGHVLAGTGASTTPVFSFTSDANTGMYLGGADTLRFTTGGYDRLTINASGNVGIGTTSSSNRLSVLGNSLFSGHMAIGTDGGIDKDYPGGYTTKTILDARETFIDMSTDNILGNYFGLTLNPNVAPAAEVYGSNFEVYTAPGNTQNFPLINAAYNLILHQGTGTVNFAWGSGNFVKNKSTGKISEAIGSANVSTNDSGGTITDAYGSVNWVENLGTGTITDAFSSYYNMSRSAGTIVNAYGVYIDNISGVANNSYGLYIANQATAGANKYALYSGGGKNYFAGNVGIGTTSPSALLTIGATSSQQLLVNNIGQVTGGTWMGTKIDVDYGGTGTSTAPTLGQILIGNASGGYNLVATGSLGLLGLGAIGTTIQPFDSDLLTYAGITPSGNIQTFLGSADYSVARANLGLDIGTNVQAYNAALTAIASGTWAGSSSISNLGTITSGIWHGSVIGLNYGGTGLNLSTIQKGGLITGAGSGSTTLTAVGTDGMILMASSSAPGGVAWMATSTLGFSAGGNGTVNVGTAGQIPYYASGGSALTATSSIFIKSDGSIGIGNSNPLALFSVGTSSQFQVDGGGNLSMGDDQRILLGGSTVIVNVGSSLSANTSLSGIIQGTPSVGAIGTDSTIFSNLTPNAEMLFIGTDNAGNSLEMMRMNPNEATVTIGAGQEVMVVDANNHVGIGTSTPVYDLSVAGDLSVGYSNEFLVNASGTIVSATGISSSGNINFSGLTASQFVMTDANKNLVSTSTLPISFGGTGWDSTGVSGIAILNNGNWGTSSTLPLYLGGLGTNVSAIVKGGLISGTGAGTVGLTAPGNNNFILMASTSAAGGVAWVATSTLGLGTVYAGTIGQVPYFGANGTALKATSSLFIATSGNIGIGTTTPGYRLTLQGSAGLPVMNIASSTGASLMYIGGNGYVGIGTATPSALLSVGTTTNLQFLVNNIGQITQGTWMGSVIGLNYGGTGLNLSAIGKGGIISGAGSGSTTLTAVGTDGMILMASSSAPGGVAWMATSTLGLSTGGNGTVNSGTTGQVPYYAGNGSVLSGTSSIFIKSDGSIGIGNANPLALFSVGTSSQFQINASGDLTLDGSTVLTNLNAPLLASTSLAGVITGTNISYIGANSTIFSNLTPGADIVFIGTDLSGDSMEMLRLSPGGESVNIGSGNTVLTIDANEYVGIGTTTPAYKLSVAGDFSAGINNEFMISENGSILSATGITSSGLINFSGLSASQFVMTDASKNLVSTSTLPISFGGTGWNSTGVTGVAILNNGNWGSSTTLPLYLGGTGANLSSVIKGGLITGTGAGTLGVTAVGTAGQILMASSTAAGGVAWVATSSLGITGGTASIGAGVTGQVPYYASNGTGLTATSSLIINSDGKIGIGTTTPGFNLTVNGSLYAHDIYTSSSTYYMDGKPVLSIYNGLKLYDQTGTYYSGFKASSTLAQNVVWNLPLSDGTPGQVLITDGNGNLSWGDAGTSGGDIAVGTTGQVPYYAASGSALSATSSIFASSDGKVGIGTSQPDSFKLQVNGSIGPDSDNLYGLGAANKRFSALHLGPDGGLLIDNKYSDAGNYEQGYLGFDGVSQTDGTLDFDEADESSFIQENLAYSATLTPSATSGSIILTLGAGSWSDDSRVKVGTRVVGNGGEAVITEEPGAKATTTAFVKDNFTNTSAISSGSWQLYGTDFAEGFARLSQSVYDDASTTFLLHADGNASSFIDSTRATRTITAYGDATQSSAKSKFGGKSAVFDGNGDGLSVPNSSDLTFGAGDFSIDMWVYASSVGQGNNTFIYAKEANATQPSPVAIIQMAGTYNLKLYMAVSSAWDLVGGATIGTLIPNTWAHVSVVRSGSNVFSFLNGNLNSTSTVGAASLLNAATPVWIGTGNYASCYFTGYIDEVRVSKGIARWTSSFTPPASPHGLTPANNYYTLTTSDTNRYATADWSSVASISLDEALESQTIGYSLSFDNRATFKVYDLSGGDTGWRPIARNNGGTWQYNSNVTAGATDVTWSAAAVNTQNAAISQAVGVMSNRMTGAQLRAVSASSWSEGFVPGTLDLAMSFQSATGQNPSLSNVWVNYKTVPANGVLTLGTRALGTGSVRDIQIKAGDNSSLYLAAGGNVGIGTSTDLARFSIQGLVNQALLDILSASGSPLFNIGADGMIGIGTSSPTSRLTIRGTGTGSSQLVNFINATSSPMLTVLENGRVGVGTASPEANLDVRGVLAVNGGTLHGPSTSLMPGALDIGSQLTSFGGGSSWNSNTAGLLMETLTNTEIAIHDSGNAVMSAMYFEGDGVNRLTIGRNMGWGNLSKIALLGSVGIGTSDPAYKLAVSSSNATDDFFQLASSTNPGVMVVNRLGNVGIGTSSPSTRLDVNGSQRIYSQGGVSTLSIRAGSGQGSNSLLQWQDSSGVILGIIDSGGNLGIGTSSADRFKLQVAGDIGPDSNNTYDLGSNENTFNSIYLGPENGVIVNNLYLDSNNFEQGYMAYEGGPMADNTLDFSSNDEDNFVQEDMAYSTTLTPSEITGQNIILTLGSGNWNTDSRIVKGVRIKGNGGIATITSDPGAQSTTTATVDAAFISTSTMSSGLWNIYGTSFKNGVCMSNEPVVDSDFDTNTNFLLHADGTDGSTVFTDSSINPRAIYPHGSVQIDTDQSRFGDASSLFTGYHGAYTSSISDYLSISDGDEWYLGNSDFTIDFWVRFNVLPARYDTDVYESRIFNQVDSDPAQTGFGLWNTGSSYNWRFYDSQVGGVIDVPTSISTGAWYHVAVVRSGNNWSVFQNGTQVGSTVVNSITLPNRTSKMTIGAYGRGGAEYASPLNGWLDEFRWSKGIARWTSNFTPSGPYRLIPEGNSYTVVTSDTNHYNTSAWSSVSSVSLNESLDTQYIDYSVSFDGRTTFKTYNAIGGDTGWRPVARNNSGTWQYNSNVTAGATAISWTAATVNSQNAAISQAMEVEANRMDGTQFEAVTGTLWNDAFMPGTLDLAMTFKATAENPHPALDQVTVNYIMGIQPTLTLGTRALGTGLARDIQFKAGDNSLMHLSSGGNIGIGTTTPGYKLSINSNNATDNLFQVATTTNQSLFMINANGNIGIGTANATHKLEVNGAASDYLSFLYNSSTDAAAGGLSVRTDGGGNILTLNAGGIDVFTVSAAQTTISNPLSVTGAGNASFANNLIMSNTTAGNLRFLGPGYLTTESSWQNLNLTLSAANDGQVVVDDTLRIYHTEAGTSTGAYYGLDSDFTANGVFTTGTNNVYGVYGKSTVNGSSTAGTVNNYGGYFEAVGENTSAAVSNAYGLFVNGAMGGDNNYSAVFMNGNVGIGTTTPANPLVVKGSGSASVSLGPVAEDASIGAIAFNSSSLINAYNYVLAGDGANTLLNAPFGSILFRISNNNKMVINNSGNVGIGTSTPSAKLTVWGTGTTTGQLVNFVNSASTSLLTVLENGNVGIGTVSPNANLHLLTTATSGNAMEIDATTVTTGNGLHIDVNSTVMTTGYPFSMTRDGGNPSFIVDKWGSSWSYLHFTNNGTVSGPSYSFAADGDTGIYSPSSNNLGIVLGGAEKVRFDNNGNVGIGTTSPSAKLTVWGTGTTTGQLVNFVNSASTSLLTVLENGNVGIGTMNPVSALQVVGSSGIRASQFIDVDDAAWYINPNASDVSAKLNGNVGIGSSSPSAKLSIADVTSSLRDVLTIATTTGAGGYVFRINTYGQTFGDGAYTQGADYAEYFYTTDMDLQAGETVCVDVTRDNAIKRCDRAADDNVMGIISTHPSIVGNSNNSHLGDPHYKVVGMLGQVPAKATSENGEIRPGDSLTAATSSGAVMRASAGDATVGVALESLSAANGTIKVLISRRNKSLSVEEVEQKVTERVAAMEIEDEVNLLVSDAVKNLDLDAQIKTVADGLIADYDGSLSVRFNDIDSRIAANSVSLADITRNVERVTQAIGQINSLSVAVDGINGTLASQGSSLESVARRVGLLENGVSGFDERIRALEEMVASSSLVLDSQYQAPQPPEGGEGVSAWVITEEGNLRISNAAASVGPHPALPEAGEGVTTSSSSPDVVIVEIETATTTEIAALVVNQKGSGDVVDFQSDGVSIMNIANEGKVSIVGEINVDGRLMVCSGAGCGSALDNAVDSTLGDMGVEGTVVAGAFAGYCEPGFVWVTGSAKYGTMPGFCVEQDEHASNTPAGTNVSQGAAKLSCQALGDQYDLISESQWLTIARDALRVPENDADTVDAGLQLPVRATSTATSTIALKLTNGNVLYNFIGGRAEWTDKTVSAADSLAPLSGEWQEYSSIVNYKGLDIAPPYYYTSMNGIGRIKTGTATSSADYLRGFVRGEAALYDLDMEYSPVFASSTVGFRCAK